MFDSAHSILDKYIDTEKVSRFTFYSIEMERGENPEDLYYLCSIKECYYVVFETDHIAGSLVAIMQEAASIFKEHGLTPLHWIVKKNSQPMVGTSVVPFDAENVDELRKGLVSDKIGSAFGYDVRYAVMEFKPNTPGPKQYNPSTYGMTT